MGLWRNSVASRSWAVDFTVSAAYKVAHVRQVELPPADLSLFVSQLQHRNRRKVHALPLDAAMALSALADGQ